MCPRCPPGRRLVSHGSYGICENINECSLHPRICHHGNCFDTEDGFYCDCRPGWAEPDCSLWGGGASVEGGASVGLGAGAVLAAVACGLVVLGRLFYLFDI
jgi:hypothetical protein